MRPILVFAAAALAAACSPRERNDHAEPRSDAAEATENAAETAPPERGPPAENGDLAWSFSEAAPGPRLAFGRPRTDDVRLMVRCADQPGRLVFRITPPEQERRADAMTLRAGAGVRTVPVSVSESGLGGLIVEGTARIDESLRRNVRGGERVSAEWGDFRVSAPAPAREQVDRLLDACG